MARSQNYIISTIKVHWDPDALTGGLLVICKLCFFYVILFLNLDIFGELLLNVK